MNKPEILAPAGSYEAFLAAVNNGCDAVYLGGSRYSARAYAGNFDLPEIEKALSYARRHNVKIYYAINTLFKEKELPNLMEHLQNLINIGQNTFIFQDLGVLALLEKWAPDIELHASTQLNSHSHFSVQWLKSHGVSRVVPSRELSLEEIIKIKELVAIELETFVHGALCYSYSGQCLMSSFIGGRSGNRGRCAQPCRLPYIIPDTKDTPITNRYLLSPKDIQTLTAIPSLVEAGIDSFKIEGRMKSPEYVGLMTHLYGKYVDQYTSTGTMKIEQADLDQAMQIFNRGGFSEGYYFSHNGPQMMSMETPKHQGILIGHVSSIKGNNLEIHLQDNIISGDALEIEDLRTGEKQSFIASNNAQSTLQVNLKGKYTIGQKVFRLKSVMLNDTLSKRNNTTENKSIDMFVFLKVHQPSVIEIHMDGKKYSVTGETVQTATGRGLDPIRIEKQMRKTGDYPVAINHFELTMDNNIFMPISQLNDLRRSGLESMFDGLSTSEDALAKETEPISLSYNSRKYKPKKSLDEKVIVLLRNRQQFDTIMHYDVKRIYFERTSFSDEQLQACLLILNQHPGIEAYIALPKILRSEKEKAIYSLLDQFHQLNHEMIDGYLVRSLDGLARIKKYEKPLIFDHGMGLMNNPGIGMLIRSENGVGFHPSLELNRHELSQLNLNDAEMVIYGYMNVMTSAQCVRKNQEGCVVEPGYLFHIEDRKGMKVPVETVCQLCYNNLYNSVPHYLIDQKEQLTKIGIHQFRLELLAETSDDIHLLMKAYEKRFDKPVIEHFTRGHFNKGVE